MAVVFDIETDGLLAEVTTIHCLVIRDTLRDQTFVFSDDPRSCRDGGVVDGLRELMVRAWDMGEVLVAHNGQAYDVPVIQKLHPWFNLPAGALYDTMVAAQLIWPEIKVQDAGLVKAGKLPGNMRGRHSLEAWGYRLGEHKGDYVAWCKQQGIANPWACWRQEMQDYCEQDTLVTQHLYEKCQSKDPSVIALCLEHRAQAVCDRIERNGFSFDEADAARLYVELVGRREELKAELRAEVAPLLHRDGPTFTPKRDLPRRGYTAGCPISKVYYEDFNPGSRQQIERVLRERYGWEPEAFTDSGQAKVDEATLTKLTHPLAQKIVAYLLVEKRIGQLAEGDEAWLKKVRNGRIHGRIYANKAVTGRAAHSGPNIAQVPKVKSTKADGVLKGVLGGWGYECRSLFRAAPGKVLVGADLSGIELRCLAHFMAKYDGGAYADVILQGDIHAANQEAAGLPSRDNAKTFIYAFLYGAGDEKLGKIVKKGAKHGRMLREKFLAGLPALARLIKQIKKLAKRDKYLPGLDGRKLHVRSEHAALNTLLQSAGALISKLALVLIQDEIDRRGWSEMAKIVAWVHDEYQIECDKEIADEVGAICLACIKQAGEEFGFRMPVAGEWKKGATWAATH